MPNRKEKTAVKEFGYTRVVWAKRSNGVPFHQAFITPADAERFADGVAANGGQVVRMEVI